MKTDIRILMTALMMVSSLGVQATTMDQVRELWDPRGLTTVESETPPATKDAATASSPKAVWYRLSNGQSINLAEWKVVLFMQSQCPYCHRFDPVLKSLSEQVGFGVLAYTIDGQGDMAYPQALPAPPEVMKTFFPNLPVATPTTFLVNVNTLEALPMLQGATDEQGFMARLDTVLQMRKGVRE